MDPEISEALHNVILDFANVRIEVYAMIVGATIGPVAIKLLGRKIWHKMQYG